MHRLSVAGFNNRSLLSAKITNRDQSQEELHAHFSQTAILVSATNQISFLVRQTMTTDFNKFNKKLKKTVYPNYF